MKPRYLIPALLFALIMAYPLSIGPAWWWVINRNESRFTAFVHFYRPILSPKIHFQIVGRVLDWYMVKCAGQPVIVLED